MKKINILIALVCSIFISSCTGDLNQNPVIETDVSKVYTSAANYKMVLAKIYASYVIAGQEQGGGNKDLSLVNGYDLLRGYFNLQEAGTDEVANTWLAGDNIGNLTYLTWDVNDPWVSDTYYHLYYTIALCNELIRHCGKDEISKFSVEEQADITTYSNEARFLRALSYSLVLDLFHKGPFVDENTPSSAFIPEAYNAEQLFNYVVAELNALVDSNALNATEYGRATTDAALALLARVYLNGEVYTGKPYYTECIAACKKIKESGKYSLEPEYQKLFNADNHLRTNEIIFAFVVDATTTVSWGATTYIICGECGNSSSQDPAKYGLDSGWGMFRVRGELPAMFPDPEADCRHMFYTNDQAQWFTGAIDNQAEGYFSEKFTNLKDDGTAASSSGAVGCSTDWPFFRLAEIYLTAAEATVRGGSGMSTAEALELVNLVRARAYGDNSGNISVGDMTLDFFLEERAREFYHEAMRRTDLVRFDVMTSSKYLWQWKGGTLEGRAVDSKFNYYPIPATELTANPNLKNEEY